jgi:predicted site-specific integrase-resolvase
MNENDRSQKSQWPYTRRGAGIDQLLTPKQASELLNVPQGTLRSWRSRGRGPAYIKIEGQARYSVSDLRDYISFNRHVVATFRVGA